jgi:nucleotide-binding universal stress UspA family protein
MKLGDILFPTDFSKASEVAGRQARALALETGARLHVVHVVPPATDPTWPAGDLARLARELGADLRVETAILSGWAGRSIVEYARQKRIDLIVLGTHGRTGVTHAILGSVAETVVRLAPCLVLTVPAAILAEHTAAPTAAPAPARRPCLVCGAEREELICEACRARIRGEALEQKLGAERPGHRGSPV